MQSSVPVTVALFCSFRSGQTHTSQQRLTNSNDQLLDIAAFLLRSRYLTWLIVLSVSVYTTLYRRPPDQLKSLRIKTDIWSCTATSLRLRSCRWTASCLGYCETGRTIRKQDFQPTRKRFARGLKTFSHPCSESSRGLLDVSTSRTHHGSHWDWS